MIGVFDSGLGGVLLLEKLAKNYPDQTFLYHADRKNVPFGNKNDQQLTEIFKENYQYFIDKGCTDLIVACNTMCSVINFNDYNRIKIHDIIASTVDKVNLDVNSNILVLGTEKTVEKGRYKQLLDNKNYNVQSIALPKLASMIEEYCNYDVIKEYVYELIKDIKNIDGIVLACTHYPAVKKVFAELFDVPIYDSNDLLYDFLSKDDKGEVIIDLKKDNDLEKYLHEHLTVRYKYYEDCFGIR